MERNLSICWNHNVIDDDDDRDDKGPDTGLSGGTFIGKLAILATCMNLGSDMSLNTS